MKTIPLRWARQHPGHRHLHAGGFFLLAAAYFGAAMLGLRLASINASASPVWPATGLAFASALLFGARVWPAIFAGAFLANLIGTGSIGAALGIGTGNTLEAVVGASLVERFAGGRRVFDLPARVLRFAAVGLPSTAISAVVGVTSLALTARAEWASFGPIALTWWLGDYGGYLVLAPMLVLAGSGSGPGWKRSRILEACGVGLVVTALTGWVFVSQYPLPGHNYPLTFVCVPPALWAAYRLQRHGAAAAVVLSASLAIWGTARGFGPFAVFDQNVSLLLTQGFMGVVAIASLVLGAAQFERSRVERRLRVAGRRLGLRFRAKQVDLARTVDALDDAQAELIRVNTELEQRVRQRTLELQRSNAELERFACAAAHDLHEPLRTVTRYTQLLAERIAPETGPDARTMLARIEDCTTWMKATIDGLLEYSRLGEATPRREAVDSGRALDRAVRNLATRVLEAGAIIDQRPLPQVPADERLLTQVFQNLVDNAIKFRGEQTPRIQVSARRRSDHWEFAVRDNGIGIPTVHLEHAFDLLSRLHTRDSRGGAGIGLATCRRIVERHGGRMWATSGPEGGTTFFFTLADPTPEVAFTNAATRA